MGGPAVLERAASSRFINATTNRGINPMAKHDEYRGFASLCLDLAHTAPSPADRTRLLTMAEAWLDLADRAGRQPRHAIAPGDHPLVRRALGAVG